MTQAQRSPSDRRCGTSRVSARRALRRCSVQDITDEAGVPKGSFYNHLDSKEALGAEIVDLYA